MQDIVGFAGTTTTLLRLRALWRDCRIFRLARGSELASELAFLPILGMDYDAVDVEPEDFWGETCFFPFHIPMFARYSEDAGLAWLKATSTGGAGYQAAILWIGGAHVFGPDVRWWDDPPNTEWPINRALRGLGVRSTERDDEFSVFGLGYRTHKDIVAGAEELAIPTPTQSD
jgi:hypothetical protein